MCIKKPLAALCATNVCHQYGRQPVLNDFSLTLPHGAFAALMGPSGSGKSTFLHVAAGLLAAERGSVMIGETDVLRLSDAAATRFRRRHVGIVFQAYNLLETLSVYENIILPFRLDHRAVDRQRVAFLLARLGLEACTKKRPVELSGGECQRVAIARALVTKPEIVLADEPTGNLDVAAARQFCSLLKELNEEEACSILLVTHDPVVAAAAPTVHFLKEGRLAASYETKNDPSEISARYLQTYR